MSLGQISLRYLWPRDDIYLVKSQQVIPGPLPPKKSVKLHSEWSFIFEGTPKKFGFDRPRQHPINKRILNYCSPIIMDSTTSHTKKNRRRIFIATLVLSTTYSWIKAELSCWSGLELALIWLCSDPVMFYLQ